MLYFVHPFGSDCGPAQPLFSPQRSVHCLIRSVDPNRAQFLDLKGPCSTISPVPLANYLFPEENRTPRAQITQMANAEVKRSENGLTMPLFPSLAYKVPEVGSTRSNLKTLLVQHSVTGPSRKRNDQKCGIERLLMCVSVCGAKILKVTLLWTCLWTCSIA